MAFTTVSRSGIFAIIGGILVVGIAAIAGFVQTEHHRDWLRWEEKLNLIADSRANDVSNWVQTQFTDLTSLANNASLQIYFITLKQSASSAKPPAQADYLRNLLTSTAERLGFQAPVSTLARESEANVRKLDAGGLALVDMNGNQLMATAGMTPIEGALAEQVKAAPRAASSLIDIEQLPNGSLRMGFVVPIYAIQAEHNASSQIGMLVGVRPINESFFALLTPPASSEKTTEVALVRTQGEGVQYLTPLLNKSPLMAEHEANDPSLAASYAAANPNQFAKKTDYRTMSVLVTGRKIANTPWTLLTKIDTAEAFAANTAWLRTMIAAFSLLILAMVSTIVAVWRHASARRALEISVQAQKFAAESDARARLLSLVTNNQPEPLYIVDASMEVLFTNQAAATAMKTDAQSAYGKSLAHVAGAARAQEIQAICESVLANGAVQEHLLQRLDNGEFCSITTTFVPIDQIPIEGIDPQARGVLITEKNITDLLHEREKRMHTLQQLIAMLVSLVDRRDPNAAQHSAHVATIAAATAREMGLDALMVETTATAARLMNLGKMDVPAELLMRTGTLNSAERTQLRSSLAASAILLDGIEFEGPVADTLRQAQEHMDGSGPLQLQGDAILVSARIIAAANAVVGMLSPRAYRKPMALAEAIKQLQTNAQFDPKVVAALSNYLLNHAQGDTLEAMALSA